MTKRPTENEGHADIHRKDADTSDCYITMKEFYATGQV